MLTNDLKVLAYKRGMSLLVEAHDEIGDLRLTGLQRIAAAKAFQKLIVAIEMLADIDGQTLPPLVRQRISKDFY